MGGHPLGPMGRAGIRAVKEAVLIWQAQGRLHEYPLEPGIKYYIGRPTYKHILENPDLSPYGIYIIPDDPGAKPYYTGYDALVVSRLDTMIQVSPLRDKLIIKNHGPMGTGAKNPTIIDGRVIGPGEEVVVPLDNPRSITIELTSLGPTFTLAIREREETTITIRPGSIVRLPKLVADALEEKGLVKQSVDLGEDKEIVLAAAQNQDIIILKREELGVISELKIVVEKIYQQLSQQQEKQQEKLSYHRIERILYNLYVLLDRDPEQARAQFKRLELEENKKLLEKLGPQAMSIYNSLKILINEPITLHKEKTKKQILQLLEIVKHATQ